MTVSVDLGEISTTPKFKRYRKVKYFYFDQMSHK